MKIPLQTITPKVLFYTYVDKKYYPFGILYPLFVLMSNKDANVEIAVEDMKQYVCMYDKQIDWYEKMFPGKVFFHQVSKHRKCQPGSVRFITKPLWYGEYVYIGDSDVVVLEEVAKQHINNIEKFGLDYSNIKRTGKDKLSGLHFIKYDKMYPVKLPLFVNYRNINDERLLYKLMLNKGYKIPDEKKCTFRPIHGIHFSFFSRPPLSTLTTQDEVVADKFPSCFDVTAKCWVEKYLDTRYLDIVIDFMQTISPKHKELRKIVQYLDMSCFYILNKG